jgi:hypothetical protein
MTVTLEPPCPRCRAKLATVTRHARSSFLARCSVCRFAVFGESMGRAAGDWSEMSRLTDPARCSTQVIGGVHYTCVKHLADCEAAVLRESNRQPPRCHRDAGVECRRPLDRDCGKCAAQRVEQDESAAKLARVVEAARRLNDLGDCRCDCGGDGPDAVVCHNCAIVQGVLREAGIA